MKTIFIGECNLQIRKEKLVGLLDDIYFHFYKKERLKHVSTNDKRLPKTKITDDLVSFSIWFKDKRGNEHKMTFDGTCFLNAITIDVITLDIKELNDVEYKAYVECLQSLSKQSEGFIMISTNGKPARLKDGVLDNQKTLLKELFEKIPNEEKEEVQAVFEWLIDCSKHTV